MKKILFPTVALLLSAVVVAAVPWTFPFTQKGLVTCVEKSTGISQTFRTESVVRSVEAPAYFFLTDTEGNTRRLRIYDLDGAFVCTVVLDP